MKKKLFLSIFIITILFMITGCKKKESCITDTEFLYDEAVKYIIDNDDNPEKNNKRYKMFVDYDGFGITKDEEYRYVYMWIAEESYYVSDNKIISGSGSSMPYKFTFALNESKVDITGISSNSQTTKKGAIFVCFVGQFAVVYALVLLIRYLINKRSKELLFGYKRQKYLLLQWRKIY